ncbi:hypothetical protein niasHT_022666 [Heterodera trifolii]|uniref:ARF7 effector protein C-terminal domain-containing protein n=1 Tax=Heterodera trifolii TaxID=157864 RepID=A0ABD2JRH8_9BILA
MMISVEKCDQQYSVYHTSNFETQWPKENDEQRFRRWNAKFAEFGNENISTSAALHRELRNLSFRNPGYRCTLPVPSRAKRTVVISAQQLKTAAEPSADRRSMRKRTAKKDGSHSDVQTRSAKSKLRYNNKGRLVLPSRTEVDLCDCLDQKCNGCQYQCKKCGGNKCSYACRVNRTTFIEHIDTLGGIDDEFTNDSETPLQKNGPILKDGSGESAKNNCGTTEENGTLRRIPMGIEVRRERPSGVQSASIKFAVLIWLTVQNAVHALLLRYSRVRDVPAMYFSTVAVFWTEVIKLSVCLIMVCHHSNGGIFEAFGLIRRQVFDQPRDTLKIVSQLKIFSAAIFSIILLNRSLARAQWVSLCVLFVGVCFVQFQPEEPRKTENRKHLAIEQDVLTGFMAASIACGLSGFSGVFFEKILKGSAPVSLWMRNVQMSVFAIPASFFAAIVQDGYKIREHGFMYGWDSVVWLTSFWYAVGGLSVAVCIKYADNIAKNFATSVAIILATLGSIQFFGFQPNLLFTLGALLVIMSIFLYSSSSIFLRHFNIYGSSSSSRPSYFSSASHISSLKSSSNSSSVLSPKN